MACYEEVLSCFLRKVEDVYIIKLTEVVAEHLVSTFEEIARHRQPGGTDTISERMLANNGMRCRHQQVLTKLAIGFRTTTIVSELCVPRGREGNREIPLDEIATRVDEIVSSTGDCVRETSERFAVVITDGVAVLVDQIPKAIRPFVIGVIDDPAKKVAVMSW